MFLIHGLEPGAVTPTSELVLSCKHQDDRERVAALLQRVENTGEPFSISYRILGVDGVERRVVLVGEGAIWDGDQVSRIEGYYIDLTPDFNEESQEVAHEAVEASADNRAAIEQAKGVLMLAYGLNPDQAFAMLCWWSRHRNIKVREIASRVAEAVAEGTASDAELRIKLDALLHDLLTE